MARKTTGKIGEGKVTDALKVLAKTNHWWWHRFPDAATCRGRLPKRPADLGILIPGCDFVLLEIKEEKDPERIHMRRLTQIPKMRVFELAGGCAFFLIFHHTIRQWRLVSLEEAIKQPMQMYLYLISIKPYDTVEEALDELRVRIRKN